MPLLLVAMRCLLRSKVSLGLAAADVLHPPQRAAKSFEASGRSVWQWGALHDVAGWYPVAHLSLGMYT